MSELDGIASRAEIREAISDLERHAPPTSAIAVAAIHVLKNELEPAPEGEHREVLFDRSFSLPGSTRHDQPHSLGRRAADLWDWLAGRDAASFRDRCDRAFYERVVPVIEESFGELAHRFMNTINEAIINYAEYSFRPRALRRRVLTHIFLTEGPLAYAIVRPAGTRLRPFDPLELHEKRAETLHEMRRGWGHTLLMRRALFLSFDQDPRRRGIMVVVGPGEDTPRSRAR